MLNLPENINLLLDEGYTWLESRTSAKYINLFMSYIVFQLRKTDRNIFVTAQEISSIDIRYRKQWDYCVKCKRLYDSNKPFNEWDFIYKIFDKRKNSCCNWRLKFDDAKKYFNLYNTNEIVPVSAKSRIEYELLKTEPSQLSMKALSIAKLVKPKLRNITQESVKFALMVLGFDNVWANSVYLILKNYLVV